MELRGSNLSIGSCPEAVNTPGRTRILEARSKPLLGQPPAFSQIETPCAVSLGNYSTTLKLQMARAMVAVPKRAMRAPSCGWVFAHHTPSGVGAFHAITHTGLGMAQTIRKGGRWDWPRQRVRNGGKVAGHPAVPTLSHLPKSSGHPPVETGCLWPYNGSNPSKGGSQDGRGQDGASVETVSGHHGLQRCGAG